MISLFLNAPCDVIEYDYKSYNIISYSVNSSIEEQGGINEYINFNDDLKYRIDKFIDENSSLNNSNCLMAIEHILIKMEKKRGLASIENISAMNSHTPKSFNITLGVMSGDSNHSRDDKKINDKKIYVSTIVINDNIDKLIYYIRNIANVNSVYENFMDLMFIRFRNYN